MKRRYIEPIEEMILSQEDQPGTHPTPADNAREPNIDRLSASRVIDRVLGFRPIRKR